MKKLFLGLTASAVIFSGTAFAGQAQNNTGCGLGLMLIGENANNSLLGQVVQATLNGVLGNQTFGITSGTSNCATPAKIVMNEKLNVFVAANMDTIATDIAKGEGESLDTMAELMNISAEKRPELYAKLQSNFSGIYTSNAIEAPEVVLNIYRVASLN